VCTTLPSSISCISSTFGFSIGEEKSLIPSVRSHPRDLRLSKVVQSQQSILLSDKRPKHGVDTVDSLGHETFLSRKGPRILEEGWSHIESGKNIMRIYLAETLTYLIKLETKVTQPST
jgi:hypothetical protein